MGGCNPLKHKAINNKCLLLCGGGGNPRPHKADNARPTANDGRTDRPNEAGTTERRQSGNRNATPTDRSRRTTQRKPNRAKTGRTAGRARKADETETTNRKPNAPKRSENDGEQSTEQTAARRNPTPKPTNQNAKAQQGRHPQKDIFAAGKTPQGVETGGEKLCSFLMFVNAGVSTPSEASQAKKLAFLQG